MKNSGFGPVNVTPQDSRLAPTVASVCTIIEVAVIIVGTLLFLLA